MASLGFTLADRLGAKSIPCSVPGCTRTWIQMAGKGPKLGGRAPGDDGNPASKMCEPCGEKLRELADVERPCDRPGCQGTWTWTLQEQLQSFATRRPPPQRLCAGDQAKLAALSDREIPCAVPGCVRTTAFTKLRQLLAGAPDVEPVPPPTMCGPCGNVYEKLKDRPVTCGIQGCKNKWTWGRDEQIRDYAAGFNNEPPRRLCDTCKPIFGAIADRDVRCRTSGCKNSWKWPREAQLDAAVAGKPLPKAPHRMCQRCIDLYSGLKDTERPCRRSGCKRTWTDKRGAQLARAVRGKTGDPFPHYCEECEKELGEMEDREVPCKTEHCPGTWTWTAAQQLAAGVRPLPKAENDEENGHQAKPLLAGAPPVGADHAPTPNGVAPIGAPPNGTALSPADEAATDEATVNGAPAAIAGGAERRPEGQAPGSKHRRRKRRREIRPPERRCDDCLGFLTDRKTREIPCMGCQTVIHWPPESQLQTHLGNWAEPTLCGACKRDLTEAARVAEREALRHGGHLSLTEPSAGGAITSEAPSLNASGETDALPVPAPVATEPQPPAPTPGPVDADLATAPDAQP